MKLSLVSIFLLLNGVNYSLAQIPGRAAVSCGYLSQKIYCFGGTTNADSSNSSDTNFMYIDIVNNSGSSASQLATKWINIPAMANGATVEPRSIPQTMVLPDRKTLLLSGGWSYVNSPVSLQTLAYQEDNDSWSVYPSYTEPPYGVRQIFRAATVYVPEYGVGFYGGQEANMDRSWTYLGQNMSQYDRTESQRYIGYTSLTFFDIRKSQNPWFVFPNQKNLRTDFPSSQTSIFDALKNKIFFFGGTYRDIVANKMAHRTLDESITFDVGSGMWGTQALVGYAPGPRIEHTTTLLTSTGRDVLLYGGLCLLKDSKPCLDYLYTLNLDSYEWKSQNIPSSDNLNVVRSEHSAVPVRNDTLFILFGKGSQELPMSSMIILNITDPSSITHLETYVDPNEVTEPSITPEVTESSSSSGLSKGATIGIAVGAVVGGLIIISAIFCVWKKNKDKKKKEELEEIQRRDERIEEPIMEVNWDMIDQSFAHSPHSPDTSTTVVSQNKSESSPNLMSVQPEIKVQRPDAIDSHSTALQKPYSDS